MLIGVYFVWFDCYFWLLVWDDDVVLTGGCFGVVCLAVVLSLGFYFVFRIVWFVVGVCFDCFVLIVLDCLCSVVLNMI